MKFTDYQVKMLFGFMVLIFIGALAIIVARENRDLQSANNADLQQVLTLLAVMAGSFSQWAFATHHNGSDKDKDDKDK